MPGHELSRQLIAVAKSYFKALQNMLDQEAFEDRIFGFHAQQTIEKILKAWLNYKQKVYPYTHDLSRLLNALQDCGADVEPYWDFLDLSAYAVRFRYEMLPEHEEPLDRNALLKDIQHLLEHVESFLLGSER